MYVCVCDGFFLGMWLSVWLLLFEKVVRFIGVSMFSLGDDFIIM